MWNIRGRVAEVKDIEVLNIKTNKNMIACIPTKGRPSTKTHKLFEASGIPVYHFIEPEELHLYEVPNKVDIGAGEQGISYVRNFILNWARKRDHEIIIMCDDDVSGFGRHQGKTINHKDASILHEIADAAKELPFEIFGMNYCQWAWSQKKVFSINSALTDVCVMMKPKKISWQYRSQFNLKEDRDFTLQTIKNGAGVFRFNKLFFRCPNVGSNTGGLYDEYRKQRDVASVHAMVKEWHPFLSTKQTNHGIDIKYDLKSFAAYFKKPYK